MAAAAKSARQEMMQRIRDNKAGQAPRGKPQGNPGGSNGARPQPPWNPVRVAPMRARAKGARTGSTPPPRWRWWQATVSSSRKQATPMKAVPRQGGGRPTRPHAHQRRYDGQSRWSPGGGSYGGGNAGGGYGGVRALVAMVAGATGLVGQEILAALLADKRYLAVHCVGRRPRRAAPQAAVSPGGLCVQHRPGCPTQGGRGATSHWAPPSRWPGSQDAFRAVDLEAVESLSPRRTARWRYTF